MMVRIQELVGAMPANTAYCLATEYQLNGCFVPKMVWIFETDEPDLALLKRFVDDYFITVLGTNLFVKEVPQDSLLFNQEAERLYGTNAAFCGIGSE